MTNIQTPISKYLSFLLIIILFSACKKQQPAGTYKNDAIPADQKAEFHQLNKQFFDLLKADKVDEAKNMLSKELLTDNIVNRKLELVGLQAKAGDYSILDEYYLVDKSDAPGSLVITSGAKNDDAYTLKYNQSTTKENYIAFLVAPKNAASQRLITAIYGKYNYGWKLNKLDVDLYALNGKNAPQLYKQAKAAYAKGFWVDAANDMTMAVRCFHPSGQWQYANEIPMNEFYYKTLQQASSKVSFPFVIGGVSTQPKVFRISTEDAPDGTFPLVEYVSKISISDTTALKKENASIKTAIGKIVPGIDQDKKRVLYTAYSAVPSRNVNPQKYVFGR
ncbi:MAG: hypothetical protein EOP41_02945 [Sphingobacteriaceae bacterium]|nr:MAG: hypothetical protein EOP41_02945 [Sphingobacteriaceae bacterium]